MIEDMPRRLLVPDFQASREIGRVRSVVRPKADTSHCSKNKEDKGV